MSPVFSLCYCFPKTPHGKQTGAGRVVWVFAINTAMGNNCLLFQPMCYIQIQTAWDEETQTCWRPQSIDIEELWNSHLNASSCCFRRFFSAFDYMFVGQSDRTLFNKPFPDWSKNREKRSMLEWSIPHSHVHSKEKFISEETASENCSGNLNKSPTVVPWTLIWNEKVLTSKFFFSYPLASIGCHNLDDFTKLKRVYMWVKL